MRSSSKGVSFLFCFLFFVFCYWFVGDEDVGDEVRSTGLLSGNCLKRSKGFLLSALSHLQTFLASLS